MAQTVMSPCPVPRPSRCILPHSSSFLPWLCGTIVLFFLLTGIFAPWIIPCDPYEQDLLSFNAPASPEHLLGTDNLGRDILSRLIMGSRLSLLISVQATLLALFLGGGGGLLACSLGSFAAKPFYAFVDVIRTMPGIMLCLVLLVALGSGLIPAVIALAITFVPMYAYLARTVYLREVASDYVTVARCYGVGKLHMLRVHILPNIMGPFITQTGIIFARVVVSESVLSFLGLGVPPDTPTWGRMIASASQYVEEAPHVIIYPVLCLSALTLSLVLLSDRLRVYLDPLRKEAGKKS